MSIITGVKSYGGTLASSDEITVSAKEAKGKDETISQTSVMSKEAAEASKGQALAGVEIKSAKHFKYVNTSKQIGKLFPKFDEKPIVKDYMALRLEARKQAIRTSKLLVRPMQLGSLLPVSKDKQGRVVLTYEFPKDVVTEKDPKTGRIRPKIDKEGRVIKKERPYTNVKDGEYYSYKMTEYDPETGKVKAVTKVYNHGKLGAMWGELCSPRMERIEYGETPKDTKYLEATFYGEFLDEETGESKLNYQMKEEETIGKKFVLCPKVTMYAKGYETDDKITGTRKAKQWFSRGNYAGYESYRENYEAPASLFTGGLDLKAKPSLTATTGLEDESFSKGLEYPITQMMLDDSLLVVNTPYVNEKGNRN